MHEQFNNEIPWLVNNKFGGNSQNPSHVHTPNTNNLKGKTGDNQLYYNNQPQAFDYQKVEPIR